MELKEYKLGDLIEVTRGMSLPGKFYSTEGEYIRLTCGNFDYVNNSFKENKSKDDLYYVGKIKPEFIMEKGDIITPLTEQAIGLLGSTAIIPESGKYIQSQDVAKITCKKGMIDHDFAYYLIPSKCVKEQLSAAAQQTKIRHTSPDAIKACKVFVPPLSEQKKIAAVLSALDDKIALNKKMNQKLEAMAKRLYDYWFVQYDFPDKNGHPYKTTGGPMTYNPTLKREIPVGWEVSNICPLMEILPGGTPSKAKPEYWNGDISFFGPTDYCGDVFQLSTEEHITENGLNNCASALYPPKTIFITARGSVGKLIVCGKPMAMNQSCYALKPFDLEKYEYLFYLTKQLIEQLKKKGSGSVFKSINTLDIEQSFLSIAPNEIIDLYCKKVQSIFERIKSNTVEIAKLTALRDKLLPLLMNGQVVVH